MNTIRILATVSALAALSAIQPFASSAFSQNASEARAEHADIGVAPDTSASTYKQHTTHPDAQWFGDAAFGLFIHWDISSVRAMNISWPMIPGRALAAKVITDPAERARIVRESDYNLNGKPNAITPNEYWSMAALFNPQKYDPDKWAAAAKAAGFTYVVLTTRHHGGFALWPSSSGGFDTKNYMGGRDLIKPYIEALRRHGLKVGLYYSPPDWHFDRDYKNFLYGGATKLNPWLPSLGADLKPRDPAAARTDAEIAAHKAAYAAHVRAQVQELLTRYGKIDLIWFDGKPEGVPNPAEVITIAEIRKLQPGIVINPRLHGTGDYVTFERNLPATRPRVNWAEFCNTWTTTWSHINNAPFRAPGFVLGQLAQCRAWGINYLLGVGPTKDGEFVPAIYENMSIVADWMKANSVSIKNTKPLPAGETASVFATAHTFPGYYDARFLFAIPSFKPADRPYPENQLPPADETLTLSGIARPSTVTLLATGKPLDYTYDPAKRAIAIQLPAALRTKLVDVVRVDLIAPAME